MNRPVALGAVLLLALAGCGSHTSASAAGAPPASSFTEAAATAVLDAFDQADAAASVAGDIQALKTQEMNPVLAGSLAAVHRAQAKGQAQPSFRHASPVFAIPAGSPSCFLVGATLRLAGAELAPTDVSQFIKDPSGGWKLSHNIQVGQANAAQVRGFGGHPAVPSQQAVGQARLQALANEVFGRSIGAGTPDFSLLAASVPLDRQLAAGWKIYTQQMSAVAMSVTRRLTQAEWSACAVTLGATTLAFLTLYATDEVVPAAGGPGVATLVPQSPDLIAVGQHSAVQGKTVTVSRVEVFLVSVPVQSGAAASVLGLSDAPIAVSAQ